MAFVLCSQREFIVSPLSYFAVHDNLQLMAESALTRGLYGEAEGLYQRLLARHGNSSDDPVVADCLRGLAACYLGLARFVEAEKAANRALAIDEDFWGGGCLQVGEAYFLMGEASRLQGFLGRAEFFYLEAMTHRLAHLGPNHTSVAQVNARLALLGLIHGLYPDLNQMMLSCYAVYETSPSHAEFIDFLELPATFKFFSEQGRRVEAEALFKNAMSALETLFGRSHRELVNLTRSYTFYAGGGAPNLQQWQKRVTASVVLGENMEQKAQQYINTLEYDKAESIYLLQLRLTREQRGEHSPEVRHILINYSTLLRRWQRNDDALMIEKLVKQQF